MNHTQRLSTIAALSAAFSLTGSLSAATVTWDGSANNNWRNNSNWSGGGSPSGSDIAVFPAGENRNSVDLSNSSGDDIERAVNRLELATDGSDTTPDTSPASNWYFKNGSVTANSIRWSHTSNNQHIIVSGKFNASSGDTLTLAGNATMGTDLYFYGDFIGAGNINYDSFGDNDDLYLFSALSFTGILNASGGGIYIRHNNALANASLVLTSAGSIHYSGYDPHIGDLSGSSNINLQAGQTLTVGAKNLNGSYSGAFSGAGTLTKAGSGVWTLSGANTHSGTIIINGGEIETDGLNVLSSSEVSVGASGTLDLLADPIQGSLSESTIGSLSGAGTVKLNNHLIINSSTPTTTFTGSWTGSKRITHVGVGYFTVTGTSGYSGVFNTSSTGGILATGGTRFANASINVTGNNSLVFLNDTTLGNFKGSGDIDLNHNLVFGGRNGSAVYSGDLSGNGSLTKNGSGVWKLNGSKSGSGVVTINSGKLGGTGVIAGNAVIASSAFLAPGDSVGAIIFSDDLDLDGGYEFEADGASHDFIEVTGELDVTGADLVLGATGSGFTENAYIIASYGSLMGSFSSVSGVPTSGYYVDYAYNDGSSSNNIALVKDVTNPTLDSIDLSSAYSSPTKENSISFDITFSEEVTGVDVSDFSVNYLGGSGSPALSGSGENYTLTIPSISGNGTLSVSFPDGSGVVDLANNSVVSSAVTGAVVVDNQRPSVASIRLQAPLTNPTNVDTLKIEVTISEDVTGLTSSNFAVSKDGAANFSGRSLSGSGSNYVLTLNNVSGDGKIRVGVFASPVPQVWDLAGNLMATYLDGRLTINIDNTGPTVSSITPVTTSPTNADSVSFDVVFNDDVTNFDSLSDINVVASGVTHEAATVTGSGDSYTVTLTGVSGDGSVAIQVLAGMQDTLGNPSTTASMTSAVINVDNTAPLVTITTAETSPTNASSIAYSCDFSEPVVGFDSHSDIYITGTTAATTDIAATTIVDLGDSKGFTLTLNNISGDGFLQYRVRAGKITDAAGNELVISPINSSDPFAPGLTVDNTAPVISLNGGNSNLVVGDTWSDPVAASDNIDTSVVVLTGGDSVNTNSAGTYNVTYDATDSAGNTALQESRTVTVITKLQDWADGLGLSGGDALPTADPDGDGETNLEEFAFDGDPRSPTNDGKIVGLIAPISAEEYFTLTFPVRVDAVFSGTSAKVAAVDGITYTVQGSAELSLWDGEVIEVSPTLDNSMPPLSTGWEYRTFRLHQDTSTVNKAFIRVEVQ